MLGFFAFSGFAAAVGVYVGLLRRLRPFRLGSLNDKAFSALRRGMYHEANGLYRRLYVNARRISWAREHQVASLMILAALRDFRPGQSRSAALYARAAGLRASRPTAYDELIVIGMGQLAIACTRNGRLAGAASIATEALALAGQSPRVSPRSLVGGLVCRAYVHRLQKQYKPAAELLARAGRLAADELPDGDELGEDIRTETHALENARGASD